jgi:hypothetical protein
MKTNIRTAKSKLFSKATIYYVPSATGVHPNDEHIVVSHDQMRVWGRDLTQPFFCDCKDFMTRRLPLLGEKTFTNCKHGQAVIHMLNNQVPTIKKSNSRKYGAFVNDINGIGLGERRSVDIPQEFSSKKAANEAIRYYEKHNGKFGRVARAL